MRDYRRIKFRGIVHDYRTKSTEQASEKGTHMTGSNMFLIFRHGVKLLGGEFLRSRGKAEGETKKQTNLRMMSSEYIASTVDSNENVLTGM